MDVKQIIEKVRRQEEKKGEYLFALQIGSGLVKSAIWTVEGEKVRILAIGESQTWKESEDLVGAVDMALSSAVEKFSPQEGVTEPDKVIFGLSSNWVEEEKIKADKIKFLKEISQKLDLKPIGFVVTIEAIIHHLKNIEGLPPTAILIGLREEHLAVTVASLGKIVVNQVVKRSGDLGADLFEGLSRFQRERLPARILLYDGAKEREDGSLPAEGALEEARQELINYPWQTEKLHFLHLPKIELLSTDFDIKAVTLAGGHEVGRARGIIGVVDTGAEVEEEAEEKEKPLAAEALETKEELKEEMFGFVEGRDVAQQPLSQPQEELTGEETREPEGEKIVEKVSEAIPKVTRKINLPRFKLPRINFSFLTKSLAGFSFRDRLSLTALLVGGGVLVILSLAIAFYWYFPRAEITLLITPRKLEKEFTFTLDSSIEADDEEEMVLAAEELVVTVEGDKTRETTGTKIVGDPAKGEVVVYNRTSSEKTFSAGTEIFSPNGLEFSLDEEVTVASESAGPDYTKIPGKASVKVTAVAAGTEGNLAAGTEFKVANYASSDFIAKNETAFSGGTSREVQVVSKEDHQKLTAELEEEVKTKAIDELSVRPLGDQKLLAESLTTVVVTQSFSKKLEEEANEVGLNLELEAKALTYSEKAVQRLIEGKIGDSIPSGFEYRPEETEINYNLEEIKKDGRVIVLAQFTAHLIPHFDLETVKNNVAGKSLPVGKTYLDNLTNVEGVEIKISPSFPGRLATFPRIAKRIEIELKID